MNDIAKWYVYELIDPKDNKVFYVGKGSGNRIKAHGMNHDTSNPKKTNKIKSIGAENVIRRKFASFWDEHAAYKCEANRMYDLLKSQDLTNLLIATTIVKRRNQPIFSVKECISYIKVGGWVLAFPPHKFDYTTSDKKHTMGYKAAKSFYKQADEMVARLRKWRDLGKVIPSAINSRNVVINLGAASG